MEPGYIKLKEIKPALAGYIRSSEALLRRSPVPDEETIHDVRVYMKKSRAVLKLVLSQLDKELICLDICSLREVGRRMCTWRESSVLRRTLKELRKSYPELFSHLDSNEKINTILKRSGTSNPQSGSAETEVGEITALLRKTGFRIRFHTMNNLKPDLLLKELESSYKLCCDLYLSCRHNPKPEKLHEFRKRAKDLLYQVYFFRPLNPTSVKQLEKRLDGLTQALGKFNDLAQLVKAIDYKCNGQNKMPALDELVIRIRDRQDDQLAKVWPSAFKVFCPGQNLVNLLGFNVLVV